MIIRDLLDMASKEKKKQERAKTMQKVAKGMGIAAIAGVLTGLMLATKTGKEARADLKEKAVNTIDTIKEKVQDTAEMMKSSAAQASLDVSNSIHDIKDKTAEVKKDVKAGYWAIKKDISETAEKVLEDQK